MVNRLLNWLKSLVMHRSAIFVRAYLSALAQSLGTSRVSFRKQDFDGDDYLRTYPDVADVNMSPHLHYLAYGLREGRRARFFDSHWYNQKYPNVAAAAALSPLQHYLRHGKQQGLKARFVLIKPEGIVDERNDYGKWLKVYEAATSAKIAPVSGPLISILLAVYNPKPEHLISAVNSVLMQSYSNWELCIADDASDDPAIKKLLRTYARQDERIKLVEREQNGHISAATNSALTLATGEYIGLLDHDDELTFDALSEMALAIEAHPEADLLYSDEEKLNDSGERFDPYFKPDFNYELFLAQNMISHFGVYRMSAVRRAGGFREGLEGAQDYDLAFRVLEQSHFRNIHHVPRVLYHWRATAGSTALSLGEKSYATKAGLKAVTEHLERIKVKAFVTFADPRTGHYRVRYDLSDPQVKVSIIIPTRDRLDILRLCIRSIFERTQYRSFEIIIVDNGSVEPETLAFFDALPQDQVRIIRDDNPFNFSALNNIAAREAKGSYLCLMNNDIEIVSANWIEEMLSFAQRPDVGCVGARLWYPDMTLQHGGIVLGIGGVAGHAHKKLEKTSTGYFCRAVHHQSYSAVTAACLMVRKAVFDQVGGLDENLPVAFNDVDFCLRVREKGYRNVWTPYAEMIHHESASRGSERTPQQKARFKSEVDYMMGRWGDSLQRDPAYNPNLTLDYDDFSLAWPPRIGVGS